MIMFKCWRKIVIIFSIIVLMLHDSHQLCNCNCNGSGQSFVADYIDCRLDLDTGIRHCKYTPSDEDTDDSFNDFKNDNISFIQIGRMGAFDYLCQKALLYPGTGLISANGDNAMVLQYDGNLCVYDYQGMKAEDPNQRIHPIWRPNWCALPQKLSYHFRPGFLQIGNGTIMLHTGYPSPRLYWLIGVPGRGPNYLKVHDDGNLCLYENQGISVWCSRNFTFHDTLKGFQSAYSACFNQTDSNTNYHPSQPNFHNQIQSPAPTPIGPPNNWPVENNKNPNNTKLFIITTIVVIFGALSVAIAYYLLFSWARKNSLDDLEVGGREINLIDEKGRKGYYQYISSQHLEI